MRKLNFLFLTLLLLCLSSVASATDVTVSTFTTGAVYQSTDNVVALRLYYSDTFVDSLGNVIVGGNWQSGAGGFYKQIACTLNSTTKIVTCGSFTLPSTLDSSKPTVTVTGVLFGGANASSLAYRSILFPNWQVPATPATWTYRDLNTYNQAKRPLNPDTYYTTAQIDSKLAGLSTAPNASDVIIGKVKLSVAPVSPSNPLVPGNNDPRLSDARAPLANSPLTITLSYSGDGSAVVYRLVKLNAFNAILPSPGDTAGVIGVVTAGGANTVTVAKSGPVLCTKIGSTVAKGDYLKIDPVNAGYCLSAGVTYPASGQVIGRALADSDIDTAQVLIDFFGTEVRAGATTQYYLNVTDYGAKVDGVTNDTTAWNAALAAAYVLKVAAIRMPGGISIVSSIVLPAYSSAGNEGISITIEGAGNPPVESGTFPGTLLTTSKASIIKSTTAGTAGVITWAGTPFQNVNLTLRNIVIRREDNPTGPGLDASNGFGVYLYNVGIDTGRYTTSVVQPTHGAGIGIKLPGTGNAGSLIISGNTSIQGFYTGLLAGEHLSQSGDLKIGGCAVAVEFPAGYLSLNLQRLNLFNCTTFFKFTGSSYVLVQQMNIEHADSGSVGTPVWQDTVYDIDDASKVGRGSIGVHITKANIGVDGTFVRNGGNYIAVHQLMKLAAAVIRYSNNAAISIANNTDTGLSFNTSDLEGEWIVHSIVGGISRFTVKQSGNYIAGGEFDFGSNATGTRLVYAKLNATTVIGRSQQDGSATYTRRINLSTSPYFLEVGDYVEFYALQDSGGALNILAVTGSSPVGFLQRVP